MTEWQPKSGLWDDADQYAEPIVTESYNDEEPVIELEELTP